MVSYSYLAMPSLRKPGALGCDVIVKRQPSKRLCISVWAGPAKRHRSSRGVLLMYRARGCVCNTIPSPHVVRPIFFSFLALNVRCIDDSLPSLSMDLYVNIVVKADDGSGTLDGRTCRASLFDIDACRPSPTDPASPQSVMASAPTSSCCHRSP